MSIYYPRDNCLVSLRCLAMKIYLQNSRFQICGGECHGTNLSHDRADNVSGSWIAQSIEHSPCKWEVPGLSPSLTAYFSHPVTLAIPIARFEINFTMHKQSLNKGNTAACTRKYMPMVHTFFMGFLVDIKPQAIILVKNQYLLDRTG